MKKIITTLLVGGLLLLGQSSFAQLIANGDFSNGDTGFNSDYVFQDMVNNSTNVEGKYYIDNTTANISGWNTITGNGNFLIVDGYRHATAINETVWEPATPFVANTSDYIFQYRIRTRTYPNQPMSVDLTIEIEEVGNGVVFSTTRDEGQLNNWTDRSVSFSCTPGESYIVRMVQRNTATRDNDFVIDDLTVCPAFSEPEFSINGSTDSPLTICDPENISMNITEVPAADHYFVGIRNLNTNQSHMRWLTASEIANNLSNFDLSLFSNVTAQSSLDPPVSSSSIDLLPGNCYEIKVAIQNDCIVWEASVQTICIEEDCSAKSIIELGGECNPVSFYGSGSGSGNYYWNFGDGTTSSFQNPVHQYAQAGTYTVTLMTYDVTACETCCDVVTFNLTVECGEFTGETMTWGNIAKEGERTKSNENGVNKLEKQSDSGDLNIYPNPSKDKANIRFELEQDEMLDLKLYNSNGAKISTLISKENTSKGQVNIGIETSSLPSGIYHVVLSTSSERKTASFVVSK